MLLLSLAPSADSLLLAKKLAGKNSQKQRPCSPETDQPKKHAIAIVPRAARDDVHTVFLTCGASACPSEPEAKIRQKSLFSPKERALLGYLADLSIHCALLAAGMAFARPTVVVVERVPGRF